MLIRRCKECPFFQETMGSFLSVVSGRADTPQGVCGYHVESDSLVTFQGGMPPGREYDAMIHRAWERRKILDAQSVPPNCPLRQKDILITLRVVN